MSYTLQFRPKARKAFLALPKGTRNSIEQRLDAFAVDPRGSDTKALKGKLRGLVRLRVGDYRVLCAVDPCSLSPVPCYLPCELSPSMSATSELASR
jgi:mRNA-degrading endonuclease RelE of RelBE toxin-antitoxin system